MREKRKLAENVWYWVWTAVNVGEPLFQVPGAKPLLCRVLLEAKERYGFEMRELEIENDNISFIPPL